MNLNIKRAAALISIVLCVITLAGCWNYREVEKLAIVSGVAIDKYGEDKLLITVEIASSEQAQQQSTLKPLYIQLVRDTFFETIRSMVSIEGNRLYWSHAKAIILSKAVAKDGIEKVLDFTYRDAEIRGDMWVLLSKESTASSIFNTHPTLEEVVSYQLDDTMRAQKSISIFPSVELYEFLDNLASKEASPILPTVDIHDIRGISISHVGGTAIFKKKQADWIP